MSTPCPRKINSPSTYPREAAKAFSERAAASPPPPYGFIEISFEALALATTADHVSLGSEPFKGEEPSELHHLLFIVFYFKFSVPENCANILFPVCWSKL